MNYPVLTTFPLVESRRFISFKSAIMISAIHHSILRRFSDSIPFVFERYASASTVFLFGNRFTPPSQPVQHNGYNPSSCGDATGAVG
jgi:hypothetical protein